MRTRPLKAEFLDQSLNFTTHRTVAHDDEFKIDLAIPKLGCRLDQDRLSLLLDDSADIHQPGRCGHRRWAVVEKHRADTERDHVNLGPVSVVRPSIKLAPREFTDRDHEPGMMDLVAQAGRSRGVKLLGAMHGEAISRPSENPAEHRRGRRIGRIMGMDVVDTRLAVHSSKTQASAK